MRVNSYKVRAANFIDQNPNLGRKQYIEAFVDMGMSTHSASLYHYVMVTKPRKQVKILIKKGPVRCPQTGRFMKRAA